MPCVIQNWHQDNKSITVLRYKTILVDHRLQNYTNVIEIEAGLSGLDRLSSVSMPELSKTTNQLTGLPVVAMEVNTGRGKVYRTFLGKASAGVYLSVEFNLPANS